MLPEFGWQCGNGQKFQLDPLGLNVAMSTNFNAEIGERWNNGEYPVFRQTLSEYSSI
jgi:hypothetical protein